MSDRRLSKASIWMYGSLGLPVALLGYPLGIWLPRAYDSYIGVPTEVVGAIISLAFIFDALTDPIMGFGSDRLRTSYGRRRVWLALGAPFLFLALWYILNPAAGSTALYLGFWLLFLRLGTTMVLVPYSAWGAELSGDYHVRTQIVSAREVCVLLGLVGAALIPAIVERIHGDQTTAVMVLNAYTLPVLVLLPITVMLVVWRVPEPEQSVREGQTPFLRSLVLMKDNKLFLRLIVITLLVEGGEAFRNALSLYFMQDYIGAPRAGALYLVYFGMGLAAIPIWNWLARRFGKHRSLSAAIVLVGIVSMWIFMLDYGDIWQFYALFAVKGFCFGAFAYLPRAMMADAIDVDTLRSGDARSGAYFSVHGFMQKAAHSFGGLSLVVLAFVGYDTTPGVAHSPEHLRWLGVLYAIVPTVTFGVALAYCWSWPLTDSLHAKLQRILEKRTARLRARTPSLASEPEPRKSPVPRPEPA